MRPRANATAPRTCPPDHRASATTGKLIEGGSTGSPHVRVEAELVQKRITTPAPTCVPEAPTEALTFADTSFEMA